MGGLFYIVVRETFTLCHYGFVRSVDEPASSPSSRFRIGVTKCFRGKDGSRGGVLVRVGRSIRSKIMVIWTRVEGVEMAFHDRLADARPIAQARPI